jgi:hypothetical protein
MTPYFHPSGIVLLGLVALVAWRMYSRMRRLIGRQRLSRVRPWVSVCLFPILVSVLALLSLADPHAIAALMAGVVAGATLAAYGLRLTKFEETADGLFYTPNAHIGIALSLLLAGRILYRVGYLSFSTTPTAGSPTAIALNPITLAIIGALAGYYFAYAMGLLRWRARVSRNRPAAEG